MTADPKCQCRKCREVADRNKDGWTADPDGENFVTWLLWVPGIGGAIAVAIMVALITGAQP